MRTLTTLCLTLGMLIGTAQAYVVVDSNHIQTRVGEDATYPNQGRHIVRDPQTRWLHTSYYSGMGEVFYAWSTDEGSNWSTQPQPVNYGLGAVMHPCVDVDKFGRPWVAGTYYYYVGSDLTYEVHVFMADAPGGEWTRVAHVTGAGSVGALSMVVSNGASAGTGGLGSDPGDDAPMAYIAVPVHVAGSVVHRLIFYAVDERGNVYPSNAGAVGSIIAQEPSAEYMRGSLCYLPGDRLYVAWQHDLPPAESRILYTTANCPGGPSFFRTGGSPSWAPEFHVSHDESEPADYPSLCADGDVIAVGWRGPSTPAYPGGEEVWQRECWLDYPGGLWLSPRVYSYADGLRAGHPSFGLRTIGSYQGQDAGTLMDDIQLAGINLSQSPMERSAYPHTYAIATEPPQGLVITSYTVWTEDDPPLLAFRRYRYVPTDAGPGNRPSYLHVITGEQAPSVYCLERTGYDTIGGHAVDYGEEQLRYQLPYLDPRCEYVLELDAYHENPGPAVYEVWVDGVWRRRLAVDPGEMETFYVRLPRAAYTGDFTVELDVRSGTGGRVSLADGFELYAVCREDGGGGGQAEPGQSRSRLPGLACAPNPVVEHAEICYTLPSPSRARAWVSDAAGRVVKEILSGDQSAGEHILCWDCRASDGRRVPDGVYFLSLQAQGQTATARLTISR